MNVAQKAQQTGEWVRKTAPWTKAHKNAQQQKVVKQRLDSVNEEIAKEQLKTKLKNGEMVIDSLAPKEETDESSMAAFKALLCDTIGFGYTRNSEVGTYDTEMRTALRNEEFLTAIAAAKGNSPLITPIERRDTRYAVEMKEVRKTLAAKLEAGNVDNLANEELDILLVAAFAKDKNGLCFPAVCGVMFDFIVSAAQRTSPENAGMFIANVLGTLASRNTICEDVRVQTTAKIADATLIKEMLSSKANRSFERAVALFRESLNEVLSMPTTELHPKLDVPGLDVCRDGVGKAWAECENATKAEAVASTAHQNAEKACGVSSTPENQQAAKDTQATLQAATERKNAAVLALLKLIPGLNQTRQEEIPALIERLVLKEKEFGPKKQELLNKYTDIYRLALIACSREGKQMDDAALGKLGDNGHPLVMELVKKATDVNTGVLAQGRRYTTQKVTELETMIQNAQLPESVKAKIQGGCELLKGEAAQVNSEKISEKLEKIKKSHGYPVKSAADYATKSYSEIRFGGMADEQWVIAMAAYQGKITPKNTLKPSRFIGFWNDVKRVTNVDSLPEAWYLRYPIIIAGTIIPVYPARLAWGVAFKNPNLEPGIKDQRDAFDGKKGERLTWWKRGWKGRAEAVVTGLVTVELISALVGSINFSTKQTYGFWNGTWKGVIRHFWRMPWNYVSVAPGSGIRNPVKWFTPQPTNADRKTIEDSYDIPERLAGRGHKYYQEAYGVGIGVAPEAKKRLDWLESHPGVLQYFQERTSNRKLVPTENLPDGWMNYPKIRGNKPDGKPIFSITYNKAAGDTSTAGTPDTVWDILYMNTKPIDDGLVLNKVNSDRFVDALMALEKSGANGHGFMGKRNVIFFGNRKLDYAFVQDKWMVWEESGFLLPKDRLELMERFSIKDNSNSLFLKVQPGAAGLLAPYATLGVSSRYVMKPDEFVTAWRQGVKSLCGDDPTVSAVSPEVLRQAFDNAAGSGLGTTIRDATAEFQEAQIMMKLGANYSLGEATKNLLRDTANADVRGLLMQFGGISGYHLNPGRVEQFVQRLAEYKKKIDPQTGKRGDIDDFNPFAQGKWVGWALGQNYFQAGAFTKDEALQASEKDSKLTPQRGKLSEEAKGFYANEGGKELDGMLKAMGAGDVQRAAAYELITGNSERATRFRTQAGITVTGTGAEMTVSIPDQKRAKACLNMHLRK